MTFSTHNVQKSCSVAYDIKRNQCHVVYAGVIPAAQHRAISK
jgi:hypothetical protein